MLIILSIIPFLQRAGAARCAWAHTQVADAQRLGVVHRLTARLAQLDALMCLGDLAATDGYTRPTVLPKDGLNGENRLLYGLNQNTTQNAKGSPF